MLKMIMIKSRKYPHALNDYDNKSEVSSWLKWLWLQVGSILMLQIIMITSTKYPHASNDYDNK